MEEWGHISAPYSLGPTEPTSLPHPLPPPQALEKLQFLYLADNLLDAIPQSLPLSLRSLHLQVSGFPENRGLGQHRRWRSDCREPSSEVVGLRH